MTGNWNGNEIMRIGGNSTGTLEMCGIDFWHTIPKIIPVHF